MWELTPSRGQLALQPFTLHTRLNLAEGYHCIFHNRIAASRVFLRKNYNCSLLFRKCFAKNNLFWCGDGIGSGPCPSWSFRGLSDLAHSDEASFLLFKLRRRQRIMEKEQDCASEMEDNLGERSRIPRIHMLDGVRG